MKKVVIRLRFASVVALAGLTIITAAYSGLLYHRNQIYLANNRQLILQNDSIISVNIELQKALNHKSTVSYMLSSALDNYKSRNPK